jgi:membrane AbrB-like protein
MTTLVTLAVGAAGGVLGHVLGIPAGALLGSLAAVAGYNVLRERQAAVPRWLRSPSRILVGATIGSLATPALLHSLGASVGWAAVITTAVVAVGLALGLLLARTTGIDRRTALLASCPGGLAEMVALAEQSRADAEVVLGIQVVRKLVILVGICTILALL